MITAADEISQCNSPNIQINIPNKFIQITSPMGKKSVKP